MTANRRDPFPAFCFGVFIEDRNIAGPSAFFKSVAGLKGETEVLDLREGGVNDTVHRRMGATSWSNLVLKRGFCGPPYALLDWRMNVVNGRAARANGRIVQYNHRMEGVCEWVFRRAWPCKWEGPDYDAAKTELGIETLELAHEGLEFRYLETDAKGATHVQRMGVGARRTNHATFALRDGEAVKTAVRTTVVTNDLRDASSLQQPPPPRPRPRDPAAILE